MAETPDPHDLWALPDCILRPMSRGTFLLIRTDNGAAAPLEDNWKSFLRGLTRFRSLKGHADAIVQASPDLRGKEPAIRSALAAMLSTGLFVSAGELARQLAAASVPDDLAPLTLAITTCDRPACLERVLESLRANQDSFSGGWACEVIDDSRNESNRRLNAGLVARAAADFRVIHVDREAQAAFVAELCARFPADADHLRWLLSGAHPDNADRPTYGIPLNHLILRHAGRRVVMIDDDATLDAWISRGARDLPAFDNRSSVPVIYPDIEAGREDLEPFPGDPLAAHARVVGARVARTVRVDTAGRMPDATWSSSAASDFSGLDPSASRVRFTTSAVLGDPGTDADFKAMNLLPAAIASDEHAYRQFRQMPRCLFSGRDRPSLHTRGEFQRATVAGLYMAPYMAPVPPTGRGEDNMLGLLMRFLHPQDFGMRCHFALEHRPPAVRKWIIDTDVLGRDRFEPFRGIALWLPDVAAPRVLDAEDRMRIASEGLLRLATRAGAVDELRKKRQVDYHGNLAETYAGLVRALETNRSGCASWRTDIEAVLRHVHAELGSGRMMSEDVAATSVRVVARYAASIPAWNRAFAFHRDNGTESSA